MRPDQMICAPRCLAFCAPSGQSGRVAEASRDVLFDVLYHAVLDIRMYAAESHANLVAIGVLANIAHELPNRLRATSSPEQHDQMLFEAWDRCDERGREWLRKVLVDGGFDPSEFPATEFRMT